MKKKFKCNNSAQECINWLEKNKERINDGGTSAQIDIEIKPDFEEK
jgi:hypothetical protein